MNVLHGTTPQAGKAQFTDHQEAPDKPKAY